jgi:hypothetical protein
VVIATLELSISYNFQHTAIYFQVFCTRFSRLDRTNIIQFVNCYSGSIPLCFCFPFSTTVRAYFVYCFELNNRYGTLTLTKSFWWFNSISILLLIQLVRGYKLDLHVFFFFPVSRRLEEWCMPWIFVYLFYLFTMSEKSSIFYYTKGKAWFSPKTLLHDIMRDVMQLSSIALPNQCSTHMLAHANRCMPHSFYHLVTHVLFLCLYPVIEWHLLSILQYTYKCSYILPPCNILSHFCNATLFSSATFT